MLLLIAACRLSLSQVGNAASSFCQRVQLEAQDYTSTQPNCPTLTRSFFRTGATDCLANIRLMQGG